MSSSAIMHRLKKLVALANGDIAQAQNANALREAQRTHATGKPTPLKEKESRGYLTEGKVVRAVGNVVGSHIHLM